MKNNKLMYILSFIVLLTGCKKDMQTKLENIQKKSDATSSTEKKIKPELHKNLYGIYTGDFMGIEKVFSEEIDDYYEEEITKRISIKINRIDEDSVYGQSIVNGNQRPFRGIYNDKNMNFVLDEPGDDKTDGRFLLQLEKDSMTGKWIAYNKQKVKAPNKTLKLQKKEFVYNPNFMLDENSGLVDWSNPKIFTEKYIDPDTQKIEKYTTEKNRVASDAIFKLNASKQKLTEIHLKNLRKLDLEIIKNSVFARHGYSFKKETFRNFFEMTDWYIPISSNVDNDLSPIEKENIALLNRFIKYAEDKYDNFGR